MIASRPPREKRCDRCEMPEWLCSCDQVKVDENAVRQRRRQLLAQPGVTTAQFNFRCSLCDQRGTAGMPMMMYADGWGHADPEQCEALTTGGADE